MSFDMCEDCAKKHLRAALAYALEEPMAKLPYTTSGTSVCERISRAIVLLAEAEAYPHHRDLALGLLVAAEDSPESLALRVVDANGDARSVRSMIRDARLAGSDESTVSRLGGLPNSMMLGHLLEARREGGIALPDTVTPAWVVENFEGLVKEAESPSPGGEKGGE